MTGDVLILGGGTGGSVLANRLSDRLAGEVDAGDVRIRMVNDGHRHVYKPTFLYVPFGRKEVEDASRPLDQLLSRRVERVDDRAIDIDPSTKTVELADGAPVSYDHLVVATGTGVDPDEIPGLAEGGHHFYSAEGATALREALADFNGGHLVVSVVGVPHMCPVAPVEFTLMADAWFRRRGIREAVDITYTYPIMRPHGIPTVADFASELFEARDVDVRTFFNAETVDPEAQVVTSMEGTELEYDLLVTIPPHTGSDLVREAGLGDDGWMEVDRRTLEATGAEDVYAIGDVADLPTSKAGSVAHYAAGVVADRLADRVRGRTPTATFDGKTVCFIETGLDEGTFIEFGYGEEPTVREPSRAIHWAKLGYNESYWLTARGLL
ncbi:MAG: NAD(P)/FAD-dependent oxidoreductase [Halobacteriales archaeon]